MVKGGPMNIGMRGPVYPGGFSKEAYIIVLGNWRMSLYYKVRRIRFYSLTGQENR